MNAITFSLQNKVAAVTGAGANGGIGHAIALGFARSGAKLSVSDIDDEGVQKTLKEITVLGCEAIASHCDISREEEVKKLFRDIKQMFGRLDILVNVPHLSPIRALPHELALQDWQKCIDISLTGFFLTSREAIALMLEGNTGGSIINIGSIGGMAAMGRGGIAYGCAKAGVNHLTKELAVEYAQKNIRVNCLVPALTKTPSLEKAMENKLVTEKIIPHMLKGMPINRILQPDEFAGPAIFLASDASSGVTGVILPVDGGNSAMNPSGMHTWPK